MNPFLILIAALAGYTLLKGSTASKLQYFPKSFSLKDKKLIFSLDAVNPTTTPLQINNVFGVVYNGSVMIGRVEYINKIFLKTGTTILNFPVIAFAGGLTQMAIDIASGKKIDLHIIGTVNAEGITYPINEKLSLK